ncbi:PREDICTED: peroxisomal membrane protein PEX13 [Nicrophorus vespilloides]|uniref:Peroxisomal membrane protein PEX13 n=1 Tax=Nicrophorus vespilloides TaxID=110193 RepID=A0ABM1NES2_NICVS|nr:PREDICTED: peroxisomal membrane protein PEX13 [Nicrophorus vespilloides]XP_017785322.1 PREDICTED: peroxisomal membrane protein PEX13 [Nicrophorus vespilloides]
MNMSTPSKPWEMNSLQNNRQIPQGSTYSTRSTPMLPPRPQSLSYGGMNSYSPYSSYGGMPYRSSLYGGGYGSGYGTGYGGGYSSYGGGYGGYGSYNSGYGMYGMNSGYGTMGHNGMGDDAERRFIQYAEESSRNAFSNVENIVRAFNSMAMMLDNTFFAMTSSFRAVLGVADNFGRLRSMFGHVFHALNIFRLIKWFYVKFLGMAGYKVLQESKSNAWKEAMNGAAAEAGESTGSSWPTIAFLGVLLSAPYLISKFLPKYEDKLNPEMWKTTGVQAKAAFDFAASSGNELSLNVNDEIVLAPQSVQTEMKLNNSGWAYATCNGRSGVIPLNYIVIKKKSADGTYAPMVRKPQKRVSFGENQIFEDSRRIFDEINKPAPPKSEEPVANVEIDDNVKPVQEESSVSAEHESSSIINSSPNLNEDASQK